MRRPTSGEVMGFVLVASAAAGFMFLVLFFIFGFSETQYQSIPIIALSNGMGVEGSFFLGCGSVNERLVYQYCHEDDSGGIHMATIPASQTTVYEQDDTVPRIVIFRAKSNLTGAIQPKHVRYEVYIPEGSVWRGHSVDVRR